MQVILHIGTDKTGSTSIQHTVFLNRDWLLSHSIYVPKTGLGADNGHADLLQIIDSQQLAELGQELRAACEDGYQKVLLSWEGMGSYRFGNAEISALLGVLEDYQIHILVYLREQAEIIQSGHLQRVKQANRYSLQIKSIESPATKAERIFSIGFFRNPNRNYYNVLRRWEKNRPDATFSVRIFSKNQLKDGDVVADFLDQLGLSRDRYFVPAKDNYNQSLDVESAMLIESFDDIPPVIADAESFIDVAQSVISATGKCSKYFLGETSVCTIRNHFRKSNLKLAKRYMGVESDPFVLSDCWRKESLSAIEDRAMELLKAIGVVAKVPTLKRVATGGNIGSMVDLFDGWSEPGQAGVWSVGAQSKIRFRVFRRRLLQEVSSLRVVIEGRYYADNEETGVIINGIDFGLQALRRGNGQLVIPIEALLPNESIEITLQHQHPTRPSDFEGKKDNRALAFVLDKVGYSPIRSYDQRSIDRNL